ncbi:MAG: 30S ribosomal protein S4 [Chloroflexi bacterium RBG_16_57_9]|nr:MAG: 30S ribosomal protein S4 [Chloroflexi bacterium RBG_16_57_9]
MARRIDPVCKLCRREGEKLFLKGERCFSPKCAIERRNYAPGMHGKKAQFRRKLSDYGVQLREKQKVRRIYGMMERQFRRYFEEAQKSKGLTGLNLLQSLERRLDNVVYRLGFAYSRAQARQLVNHGHFEVNGVKTDVPSYLLKPGDQISVREKSRNTTYFKDLPKELERVKVADWLSLDARNLGGRVVSLPNREDIEQPIKEQLIVEFYSR